MSPALAHGRRGLLLLASAALLLSVGCERTGRATRPATQPAETSTAPAIELRDWVRSPEVAPEESAVPALRIVSSAPSATEICCALGLRNDLVGRTRYCTYPPEVAGLPAIGALNETNVEVLLGLRPDMVLVSGTSRAVTDRLERLDLRYVTLPDKRLEDVFAAITSVGAATQRARTAERLCANLRDDLERVRVYYAPTSPVRVLVVLGVLADPPAPLVAAGPGSFYDDLLHVAGQRNAVEAAGQSFGLLSLEYIVKADPDVIIELDADGRGRSGGDDAALEAWRRLGSLEAVRRGRVHVLSGQQYLIPGPRIAFTLEALCAAIARPAVE